MKQNVISTKLIMYLCIISTCQCVLVLQYLWIKKIIVIVNSYIFYAIKKLFPHDHDLSVTLINNGHEIKKIYTCIFSLSLLIYTDVND